MKHTLFTALALTFLCALNSQLSTAFAQGTAFMYQGQLVSGGAPANGSYDLTFSLFDTNASGVAIAGPVTNSATTVTNGLFTVTIDFGGVFTGTNYWLELAVQTNGGGGFTTLSPRQPILPTPYAIYSANAGNATTAGSATTATTANNFSGPLLGDVTGTQGATVVSTVGGVSAANVAGGANAANAATSLNTANTIVSRDASGNFSAGTITATLAGNAATATTAANVTGNIADSQLSANIARLNGTNSFTGTNNFAGMTIVSNLSVTATNFVNVLVVSNPPTLNGSAITGLNASQLTSGTVPLAQLSGITSSQIAAATWQLATNLNGGNAALASNVVSGIAITNAFITNSIFAGDGAGLTNLNASKLSSGVIPLAQLPGTVLTNNESAVTLSGTFIGDGSGLTNLTPGQLPLDNTAVGQNALLFNTNGYNTAVGFDALYGNISGKFNTAVGLEALEENTSGSDNTAIGPQVLDHNTNGMDNTAIGFEALFSNTSGNNNIALGYSAGYYLTTGGGNIDIGNFGVVTDTNIIRIGTSQTQTFIAGVITGNGAGLTNLTVTATNTPPGVLTNNESGVTLSGTFSGNGAGLTNLNVQGSGTGLTNNESGVTLSGTFSGNGAGLTNLNASKLSSGVIPLAQLPGAVITNNESGPVTFNGTLTFPSPVSLASHRGQKRGLILRFSEGIQQAAADRL